jgi:hypothetical protein
MKIIHKKVQELATGTASARDLNRDLSRFSNPTPIVDRLGREKFKDRDDGAASCQLLNLFVYIYSTKKRTGLPDSTETSGKESFVKRKW